MEIKHLEYFIAVSRFQSFSKAADQIHVSQPNISKAIKEMEQELGHPLFYRTSKQIRLTDAGQLILKEADQIVVLFRNMCYSLENTENLSGQLHIGLPPITAVTCFASVFQQFKTQFPKIDVHLYEFGPKQIEAALLGGTLDFGIFTPEDSHSFEWIYFDRDPHWILVNKDHPLAAKKSIQYHDLDEMPLILYTRDYKLHDNLLSRCAVSHAYPKIVLETTQLEMMTNMVEAGLGLAFLPSKICRKLENEPNLRCLTIYEDTVDLELALTWKRDRYLSFAAQKFLEVFRAMF